MVPNRGLALIKWLITCFWTTSQNVCNQYCVLASLAFFECHMDLQSYYPLCQPSMIAQQFISMPDRVMGCHCLHQKFFNETYISYFCFHCQFSWLSFDCIETNRNQDFLSQINLTNNLKLRARSITTYNFYPPFYNVEVLSFLFLFQ